MPFGRSILPAAARLFRDFEALLLPVGCLGCGRLLRGAEEEEVCCRLCRSRLRLLPPAGCARCAQPPDHWGGSCALCRDWPAELDWASSAVWLEEGPAEALVHSLKFGGWTVAARPMAEVMARSLAARLAGVDYLVPIPLGRRRLKQRGHNQAGVLAAALGRVLGVPVREGLLSRVRETAPQTDLAPRERWANLAGAFVAAGAVATGTMVALVDDVMTTGATAAAAARAMGAGGPGRRTGAGGLRIGVVTFARAPVPGK